MGESQQHSAEQVNTTGQPGFVYTFYSYKGGVGRSMALVNCGVLMALWGHRVLLVDWDLEAPGLESFFSGQAKLEGNPTQMPGIVDMIEAYSKSEPIAWNQCLLKAKFTGGSLDLISAGQKTASYRTRVQNLNWDTLFREHRIGNYINQLRNEWRKEYDFVLIDSRTGITDIGDICTVLLPDVLVLMLVTNYQNLNGIRAIMERAKDARKRLPVDRSLLVGLPVPARDEIYNEYDKSVEWKNIFAKELGHIYREWLPREVSTNAALNKIFIPYVARWSFGECIPVLENEGELQNPTTIGNAYARLATLLTSRLDWQVIEESASPGDILNSRLEISRLNTAYRSFANEIEKQSALSKLQLEFERERKMQLENILALQKRRWRRIGILTSIIGISITTYYTFDTISIFQRLRPVEEKNRLIEPIGQAKPANAQQFPSALDTMFYPSGWMGDGELGQKYIRYQTYPEIINGEKIRAIEIVFRRGPKGFAGLYWQYPDGNWGQKPGRDLSGAQAITFLAKGGQGGEVVEFKSGGISGQYQDSYEAALGKVVLSRQWKKYKIDLSKCNLSNVIGALALIGAASDNGNKDTTTYLANIQIVGPEEPSPRIILDQPPIEKYQFAPSGK
ncbi:MAG: AAA family ATPase [Chlorobium sp.]